MILNALAVTAMTNFALAAETFFLSGILIATPKIRFSAAWYWQWVLLALALAAFLGGIDHGFFEVHGQIPVRKAIEHANWIVLGVLTLALFLSAIHQFVRANRHRFLYCLAYLQFVLYGVLVFIVDTFVVVIVNYSAIMLWLLLSHLAQRKHGTGSLTLATGISIAFLAALIPLIGLDMSASLDRNGLYHLLMMISVYYLFRGGFDLQGIVARSQQGVQVR